MSSEPLVYIVEREKEGRERYGTYSILKNKRRLSLVLKDEVKTPKGQ